MKKDTNPGVENPGWLFPILLLRQNIDEELPLVFSSKRFVFNCDNKNHEAKQAPF